MRYMNICANHTYRRMGGQATLFDDPVACKAMENTLLKKVAVEFPTLLIWTMKKNASMKTMQYQFSPMGLRPLRMMTKSSGGVEPPEKDHAFPALGEPKRMKKCRQSRQPNVNKLSKDDEDSGKRTKKL